MPTDRWHRVEQLFTEAVDETPGRRADLLAHAGDLDAGLRDEVASLLTAADEAHDFLGTPALDVLARQISREGWSVRPGDRVGSYVVERRLGTGGMGEVWRARDERLGRDVAIKLLLPHASDTEGRVRAFEREARAAGALNHTNVLTVYDVGDHDHAPYIVTECLEGESLRARLGAGALSVDAALDVAVQVARGLGAAHARGIVHRDLKPENIFLALDGRVKILDFGLATLHDAPASTSPAAAAPPLVAGTAPYMAPEQVRGEAVDGRADVFALGAVLHEMLAGRRPFKADSTLGTLEAVLTQQPKDLSALSPDVPPALSQAVRRCLAKSREDRFATVADLLSALESIASTRNRPPAPGLLAFLRRPKVIVPMVVATLSLAAFGWRWLASASRARWARTVAVPEAQRLLSRGDTTEAFLLARRALDAVPDDPQLKQLWLDVSIPASATTDPAGADVAIAPYRAPTTGWWPLGRTPLAGVRIPRTLFRVRVSKPGFEPIEGSGAPGAMQRYRLDPVGAVPPGMVRVTRGRDHVRFGRVGDVDDFWIDRFEVTNRQFKEFVDHGGYARRDLWREAFFDGQRQVPWEEAVGRFRDATGRPGPATWSSGTYPEGQADFPVGGVSWFEATAYAAFAGKSLPTIYHWYRAAALGRFADILARSNIDDGAPARVGRYDGIGPFGTYDMAGNVKEWCSNATDRRRFLLGGAWNESRDMFADFDAKGPFERAPGYGLRLAKYMEPPPPAVTAPVRIDAFGRDASRLRPVGDATFAVYRRQYAYDHTALNTAVEAREGTGNWVKETVAFDAAHGDERMRAFLFLPKNASPPYQAVVFFPAADAFLLRSSRDMSLASVAFIIRSGRALLYPVYKGTYERPTPDEMGPVAERELRIAWSRDLGRAIDYLETRSDVDRARLAFYGVSVGADAGVILTALEPRLAASVIQGTGLGQDLVPEIDLLNYAPRVKVPTLMLNGRYDYESPLETSQRPLFELLGPAGEHKRHVLFETGHSLPIADVAGTILPWLDHYLGPVSPHPADPRP